MTHRVTIYWRCDSYKAHNLMWAVGLPFGISLNGEQYLDVTDEQMAQLREYETTGALEFRNKVLIETPHGLQPDKCGMRLTNNA